MRSSFSTLVFETIHPSTYTSHCTNGAVFMKRKIVICMGSSCFARGNEENLRVIEDFLKSNNLQAEVLLSGRCCAGICSEGPNIIIDETTYSHVSKEALIDILNREFLAK